MKAACRRPSHYRFKGLGGKGIGYHPKWEEFRAFARWARASGYGPALALARKDRTRNFTPANCHWRPYKQRGRQAGRSSASHSPEQSTKSDD